MEMINREKQTYTRGHNFFNGMPMADQFADAIENYCKSARQNGDLRSKEEISSDWQEYVLKKSWSNKIQKHYTLK